MSGKERKSIVFLNTTCFLEERRYMNGRLCLDVLAPDGPMAKATVNVPVPMEPDEVAIKDYSENAGMLKALVNADVVAPPHRYVKSHFVVVPICRYKGIEKEVHGGTKKAEAEQPLVGQDSPCWRDC